MDTAIKMNFYYEQKTINVAKHSRNSSQSPRLGEEARMQQLLKRHKLSGGRNSRPLVGGFAAAAYEAMKEHHYSNHCEAMGQQ